MFLHDLKVEVAHHLAAQGNSLVGEKIAHNLIDDLISFIGINVDESTVDVEDQSAYVHANLLRISFASVISSQRYRGAIHELRAIRRRVRPMWKGIRLVME